VKSSSALTLLTVFHVGRIGGRRKEPGLLPAQLRIISKEEDPLLKVWGKSTKETFL
jgi:hypothetical protein